MSAAEATADDLMNARLEKGSLPLLASFFIEVMLYFPEKSGQQNPQLPSI
jgi:hypothetical protein